MAIRVGEFSNGGTKLERYLPKNQHYLINILKGNYSIFYPPFENSTTRIAILHTQEFEQIALHAEPAIWHLRRICQKQ